MESSESSDENLRAVKRALATLPDNAAEQLADADVRQYTVVRVADEIVVDLMAAACGLTYADAVREGVETRVVNGVPIPIAGKRVLKALVHFFRLTSTVAARRLEPSRYS